MTLAAERAGPGGASRTDTVLLPRPDARILGLAGLLLLAGAVYAAEVASGRMAGLYLLGAALGLVLFHAAFGFASSWRAFLAEGRGAGLRAQLLMLALASVIFLPALEAGSLLGRPIGGGALGPFGVSVLLGAFLFGIGMQLGGGCASGTLYTLGGGSGRMVVVLAFFVAGSLFGSAQLPWWQGTPSLGTLTVTGELGLAGGLAAQLAALAAVAAVTLLLERRRRGRLEHGGVREGPAGWRRLLRGPWPLLWGALALALLNAATLALAGHPWTITFGYSLWGAKAAAALGLDVAGWQFWTWPYPKAALAAGLFENTISVMNVGILVGAFLGAGLAGRFGPLRGHPWRSLLAAALGGLLMGYGARLAYGCNIGAFFSGIASGSLHGWLWFGAALLGTWLGLRLRPLLGLSGGGGVSDRRRS